MLVEVSGHHRLVLCQRLLQTSRAEDWSVLTRDERDSSETRTNLEVSERVARDAERRVLNVGRERVEPNEARKPVSLIVLTVILANGSD